jgi:hypothetical protein
MTFSGDRMRLVPSPIKLTLVVLLSLLAMVFWGRPAVAGWVELRPGMSTAYDLQVDVESGQTVVRLRLHGFEREPVASGASRFEAVTVPGFATLRENGAPALPVLGVPLLLASSAAVVDVASTTVLVEAVVPAPFQAKPGRCGAGIASRRTCDLDIYNGDEAFPDSLVRVTQQGSMRGRFAMNLELRPFRFHPASRSMSVATELVVTLSAPLLQDVSGPLKSSTFQRLSRGGFYQQLSPTRDDEGRELLLVIVHDDLYPTLEPFVAWKESLGYEVKVLLLSEAGTTHVQLKETLQAAYDNWPVAPTYVLLVGDGDGAAKVPFVPSPYGCASDFLFSNLDGDDLYSDVLVGRISAHTPAEATMQLAKTIWYERDILLQSGGDWLSQSICISSSEGSGGSNDDVRSNVICNLQSEHGYDPADKLFHSNGKDKASIISGNLNQGRGWVTYLGHGSGHSWATTTPPYEVSHIQALSNGHLLPFIVDISCSNGEFDAAGGDCFAEAWMKTGSPEEPRGAVGIYSASTPTAWDEPAEMAVGMTKALLEQGIFHWSALAAAGRSYMMDVLPGGGHEEVCHQYVVFGDPTLQLRTRAPGLLDVDHPAAVPMGTFDFAVQVSQAGQPVVGATVALQLPGGNFSVAKTGASGAATLMVDAGVVGTARLTVSAADAVPYIADIETMVPGCGLLQADVAVSPCLSKWQISLFDADLNAVPGEVEGVTIAVHSSTDPQGVSVTLLESGVDSGKFVGEVTVNPSGSDGGLAVAHGDLATLVYQDEACGDGAGEKTFVVAIDCQGPVTDSVSFKDVKATSATVTFAADELASGNVLWGTSVPLDGAMPFGPGLVHEITLSGLSQETTYLVAVQGVDVAGNEALDDNEGGFYSFTTASCQPFCEGKQCGPDGCGGVCGGCCEGQVCQAGLCVGGPGCVVGSGPGCGGCACEDCVCDIDPYCCQVTWDDLCVEECIDQCGGCGSQADCAGKECGPNGCGGSCGECPMGWDCADGGTCVDNCEPSCLGVVCGTDGCGGSCGECGEGAFCIDGVCLEECGGVTFVGCCDGATQHYCEDGFQFVVDCAEQGLVCGWKASLGWYECVGEAQADPSGAFPLWCPGVCPPQCDGKECGPDGCDGSCGECGASAECIDGQCVSPCEPSCAGLDCGDDGCGGVCGECPMGLVCMAGHCQVGCIPVCDGRDCGDDGCGGTCGFCAPGMACSGEGTCGLAQQQGDVTAPPDVGATELEEERRPSGGCAAAGPAAPMAALLWCWALVLVVVIRRTSRA